MIKITKCPPWVVHTFVSQIQDGRRPQSWKNRKNCHISAMVWPIDVKFRTATHFTPLHPSSLRFLHFYNPRWRRLPSSKIEKLPYLINSLTHRREIWHSGAVWPSWPFRSSKIQNFKNPRSRRLPSWEVEKSSYLKSLTDRRKIWLFDAYWHIDACLRYRQLKIRPFRNLTWCTATVLTVEKSQYVGKCLTYPDDLTVHINPD